MSVISISIIPTCTRKDKMVFLFLLIYQRKYHILHYISDYMKRVVKIDVKLDTTQYNKSESSGYPI